MSELIVFFRLLQTFLKSGWIFFIIAYIAWLPAASAQTIRHHKVREAFRKYRTAIVETRTDCWDAIILMGDLNKDGRPDAIVAYGCGVPEKQRSYAGIIGWAVFLNVNEKYKLLLKEEGNLAALLPRKIYKSGVVTAEKYTYGSTDLPFQPTVVTPLKVKFDGKKFHVLPGK